MSHDRTQDRIELQRYFSETGSVASVPNGNMSASGSFTGSTAISGSVNQHTDADNEQNPTYFSIPEAQDKQQEYMAAQEAKPSATSTPGPTLGHTPSDNGHTEGTESQYDFIPDSKHKGPSYPTGGILQAENILYEQATGHLHHQTLTMDRQQYKGSVSPDPPGFHKQGSGCNVVCKRVCQVMLVLLLCLVLLVALAAGVLSLAIIFTGFVDICGKCGSSGVVSSSLMIEELRAELQTELQTLQLRVMELEQQDVATPSTASATMTTPPATVMAMTTPPATVMTTSTIPPTSVMDVVTLSGVDLFQNCTTSVELTCLIPAGMATGTCSTLPGVPLNTPGEFVLNINCLRAAESTEINPLIATLDIVDSTALCLCYVPDLDRNGERLFSVMCGIQVTRCVTPLDIKAIISNEL